MVSSLRFATPLVYQSSHGSRCPKRPERGAPPLVAYAPIVPPLGAVLRRCSPGPREGLPASVRLAKDATEGAQPPTGTVLRWVGERGGVARIPADARRTRTPLR